MVDSDRGFVSQYSQQDVGITITVAGTPTDADDTVSVTILDEDTQDVLLTRVATHVGVGQYQITLTPDDTATVGNYQATWSYDLSAVQKTFQAWFAVGGAEPAYDALSDPYKAIVDSVWIRIADLFDSPSGGPNLITWAQSKFNRGRIAQLMRIAMGTLNTMAQPTSTFSVDDTSFPIAQWGPLLERMTWIEVIKHLRRSYAEIPVMEGGVGISVLDRQAYFDRWGAILADEERTAEDQLSVFKIKMMFLGRPALLVSGGVYPRGSLINQPFMAARQRLWWSNGW